MAKEIKKEITKPVVRAEPGVSFFPKLEFIFSILVIALAVNNYFKFYLLPTYVFDAVLFIAGLWMLKLCLEKGLYNRRKELLKRYI